MDDETLAIDLSQVRELLDILREKDVHSCQIGNFTVVFNDKSEFTSTTAKVGEEVALTNKRVDGFRNPSLYPWQNGKVLKFDGSME